MTAIYQENNKSLQLGENCHTEYGWSNDIREKILQFSFQINRTNDDGIKMLESILTELLNSLSLELNLGTNLHMDVSRAYLKILYKMIGHTRDIVNGKGEYAISYMMIYTWYNFDPELSKFALSCFVNIDAENHPYGSWKDIKYFCEYCKNKSETTDHPLIQYSVQLINEQLRKDLLNENCNNISLVSKWVPREKSKFSWLYEILSTDYFNDYLKTATSVEQIRRATLKCKTEYRKIISSLNRKIDTLQIKQCEQKWSSINFNNVTSISLSKQKRAFLNLKKNGNTRYHFVKDRIECAEKFNEYIIKVLNDKKEMKGKRVGMADFTKQALELLGQADINITEKELLNSQWRNNSSQNKALGKMIAMVDTSGSMEGDPLYVAIAIGIRIAEKSILGKRIMTFSQKPTWVNLEKYPDFISQVNIIRHAQWGMNTNFYAALDMILNAIVENKLTPEDAQDMVLVVLSDMQIDSCDKSNKQVLYDNVKQKYEMTGLRVHGKPYKPPHILFWNLRTTRGFPSLSNQPNVSMLSGFNPTLLNLFCEEGIESLQSCTPWSILVKSLENSRYEIMDKKISNFLSLLK